MGSSVGLDIGSDCIKAVEIDDGLWVSKYAKIDIPRPFEGDESVLYTNKINELFNTHEFTRDNVTTNIRGAGILARSYSRPLNGADFEQWFVDNIESLIPGTPIEDVFYDYQFVNTERVLISFARLRLLQNQIAILKSCGIIPKAIDASCLALYYLYQNHSWTVKKKNYAILDIGGFTSDLLVMKDGVPFTSTEVTFGSQYLKKGKHRCKIFSQELTRSLQKVITYYQENEELTIGGLIVLGDCADTPGLRKNMKRILGIKTRLDLPQEVNNGFMKNDGHCYGRAVGLALKGLNSNPGINLMTPEAREARKSLLCDKKAKKTFKKNILFSTATFAVFAFVLFTQMKDYAKLRSHLDLLTDNRNALMSAIAQETALSAKYNELNRLAGNQFFWSRLLYNVGYAIPPGLYLTDINTESRMVGGGNNIQTKKKVAIKGRAHSSETVITFVRNLEKHFTSIVVDQIKEESGCEFRISIVI